VTSESAGSASSSAVGPLAELVNVSGDVWMLTRVGDGAQLARIEGRAERVLGPAAACLVADHGFEEGRWSECGPGRYAYQVES
jgi:hypothetical protein